MNPKRVLVIGTIAVFISIGGAIKSDEASAKAALNVLGASSASETVESEQSSSKKAVQDEFLEALGASSDEEVYDALYSGQSLTDITQANNKDVQRLIDLQVAQLSEQLDARLASGSLDSSSYQAHKAELVEMITKSAYGGITN